MREAGDYATLAGWVCVAKTAARQIRIEEYAKRPAIRVEVLTFNAWTESNLDFGNAVEASLFSRNAILPLAVDSEIYQYFLGVVPPRKYTATGFLCGEAVTHDGEGFPLYREFSSEPAGADVHDYYKGLSRA